MDKFYEVISKIEEQEDFFEAENIFLEDASGMKIEEAFFEDFDELPDVESWVESW